MKKNKLLMSILGITSVATITMPLSGCSCKKSDTDIREVNVDSLLSNQVTCTTTLLDNGDYNVVLSCKDNTKYIPKVRSIIIGEYVLRENDYSFTLKTQTIVIKKEVINNNKGWITILPETPAEIVLKSIKVTTLPTKTSYKAGEKLDLTGMVVTGTLSNENTIEIKDYTTDPAKDTELTADITKVTVKYQGLTCTFDITVAAVTLISIKVTTLPDKVTYNSGEKLDLTGMVVKATYSDSSTQVVSDYTTSPTTETPLTENDTEVTVTYQEKTDKFNITVNPVVELKSVRLTATEETTMKWTKGLTSSVLKYSFTGNDDDWTDAVAGTPITFGKDADKKALYLKGTLNNDEDNEEYNNIRLLCVNSSQPSVTLAGSLMYLLLDDQGKPSTTLPDAAFEELFAGSKALLAIDETNEKLLPVTNLSMYCYDHMFENCTSLKNTPSLPSTELADNCYQGMFSKCESLEKTSTLPSTDVCKNCYNAMFFRCRALEIGPALPAETLAKNCYANMFESCSSLKTIPEISAKTLDIGSCNQMFDGCANLKVTDQEPQSGSKLFVCPADTTPENCVAGMFNETHGTYTADPQANTTYYIDYALDTFANTSIQTIVAHINKFEKSNKDEESMKELCSKFTDTPYIDQIDPSITDPDIKVARHLSNFIGKEIKFTLNDKEYKARIIGINHDELTNPIYTTTKALFTFEIESVLSDENGNAMTSAWNTNDNHDYTNSVLRKNLTGIGTATKTWTRTALSLIQETKNLYDGIKSVTKVVKTGNSYDLTEYDDKLFPLTVDEMGYVPIGQAEGQTYEYWHNKSDSDKIKKDINNNSATYWLVSPYENDSSQSFTVNSTDGSLLATAVNSSNAVSFAFCI